jgi:ribonuclease G
MAEEILVNITPREVRIALLENGILQELHVERSLHQGIIGNIYKGKVNRILPGIQAAFVDIGIDRSAFLHVSDIQGYEDLIKKTGNPADIDMRDFVKPGQELLVQVYKDPLGSKGARLTTQFTIPSRYLVFTPKLYQVSVSQKINDDVERQRLISMITPNALGGYIFRTVAEGITQADVDADKVFLEALWSEVERRSQTAKLGELVYEEIPIVLRVLRDWVGYNNAKIRVDHQQTVDEMRKFAERYAPNLLNCIEYYSASQPIFDLYSVEDELQKALYRKVYLKSGGHLIFDQTEAMTTIDVNTGSYLGAGNLEQTIFKTNLEAIEVIARQIRLRNLGGIIIIDFIDMNDMLHKEHLLQSLANVLAKDPARVQISELSSLGLVQLTRKRARESLEHILCVPCPLCQKRGSIKSIETIVYEIFRELKRATQIYPWNGFLVLASEKIANCLIEEESALLADLEVQLGKSIKIRVESSFTQENYNILPLSEKD